MWIKIDLFSNQALFVKSTFTSFITLFVYIDDIVLGGNDTRKVDYVKQILYTKFKIKDLGSLRYFVGLQNENIFLNFWMTSVW